MSFGCRVSGENDAFESSFTMEASAFIGKSISNICRRAAEGDRQKWLTQADSK
jgi:hypothetical protein